MRPGRLILAACVALASSCTAPPSFRCAADSECTLGGLQGACESTRYCSFPDPECATPGRRYGRWAGDDLAGSCVPAAAGDGGGPCGGDGQPCCAGRACWGFDYACDPQGSMCRHCGSHTEPCCLSAACSRPWLCLGGLCE